MRIALVCPYAWDAPGGVQVHVRQLARHLERRNHRTLVIAPAFSSLSPGTVSSGTVIIGRPVRLPYNGSVAPVSPDPRTARRISAALRSFAPDVVHVHEPFAPSTSLYASLVARAPVVGTFHAYAARSRALAALSPILRLIWNRLAVRLAVSRAAASFVSRYFRGAVRVVPNGVDVELFASARAASLPPGRALLFVNRLEPRKGFRVATEAFELLAGRYPDVLLVVAGDGAERVLVAGLPEGAKGRVILLGSVPHEDLPPYHAAAELFLAPATGRESFGIVLVEAMAAGLPVVASDIPGYREVVRDGVEALLVPPEDAPALAAALGRILDDQELAASLGAAGRMRAERYRWEAVAADVESAYREAIERGARGAR
ncbi:glycosyltransferase family 4 protein [soil metagenome]